MEDENTNIRAEKTIRLGTCVWKLGKRLGQGEALGVGGAVPKKKA
jgi:hypothetical protein